MWNTQRTLLKCARSIRAWGDAEKLKIPSVVYFKKVDIANQLGKKFRLLDDVLELMEEKKWAVKVTEDTYGLY